LVLIVVWYRKAVTSAGSELFIKSRSIPLLLVLLQVVLGIFTVLYADNKIALLWLGVAHQFTAMVLVLVMVGMVYLIRGNRQ
jgi:cytochrome c oxidase assembly protein subunit 15